VLHIVSCSSVSATSSPPGAAAAGTSVTITATVAAPGCPQPLYAFWILEPGSSMWHITQRYSTNPAFVWNTVGKPAGTYRFSVWAKDSSSAGIAGNTLGRWDSYSALAYSLG
jgi:hypothetical protein